MNECVATVGCKLPNKHEGRCDVIHKPVVVIYKNWKGVVRERRITPVGQLIFQSNPPWHPTPQWLLGAIDDEDGQHKFFAMEGFRSWREEQ